MKKPTKQANFNVTYSMITRYTTTVPAQSVDDARRIIESGDFSGGDYIEESLNEIESVEAD